MAGMGFDEGKGNGREPLLSDPVALQTHIVRVLHGEWWNGGGPCPPDESDDIRLSAVLLLLGVLKSEAAAEPEICVVLNKRSEQVRQSGDLCCPGGTVELRLDPWLAKIASLPGFPLARWPHWPRLRRECPAAARKLAMLFAAGLRESWEEMRLNPFGIRFLGPLPSHRLVMFRRVIHPTAGWIKRQEHFELSWEVEEIIVIPLRNLLDGSNYAKLKLDADPSVRAKMSRRARSGELPCYLHRANGRTETLWGATFHIVTMFLKAVFGFTPPENPSQPVRRGLLDASYFQGREGKARS